MKPWVEMVRLRRTIVSSLCTTHDNIFKSSFTVGAAPWCKIWPLEHVWVVLSPSASCVANQRTHPSYTPQAHDLVLLWLESYAKRAAESHILRSLLEKPVVVLWACFAHKPALELTATHRSGNCAAVSPE